jgi:hypothetical protein
MNKVLNFLAKVYLISMGITLLIVWLGWHTQQDTLITLFEVTPLSPMGINMLKGDIGGAQFTIAIFAISYFIKGKQWLYPLIILISAIVGSRIISLFMDGHSPLILIIIGLELIGIVAAWKLLRD